MRTSVAGTTIDVQGSAWFANFADAWPIFHAWAPDGRTRCGLTTFRDGQQVATAIPPRLAVKIGRPCRRCWREIPPGLFARRGEPRATHRQGSLLELTGTTREEHA